MRTWIRIYHLPHGYFSDGKFASYFLTRRLAINDSTRCISSCTAHIEELEAEDCISDFTGGWRQFRLVVGAPDAEAKLTEWKKKAADQNANAARYPTLLAFHGSATQNWHSVCSRDLEQLSMSLIFFADRSPWPMA